jgi:hypothetical protein
MPARASDMARAGTCVLRRNVEALPTWYTYIYWSSNLPTLFFPWTVGSHPVESLFTAPAPIATFGVRLRVNGRCPQ